MRGAPYLQAGVGAGVTEVVESPWLRRGVHRFPLEFRRHSVSPGELVYAHGDRTFLPGLERKVTKSKITGRFTRSKGLKRV